MKASKALVLTFLLAILLILSASPSEAKEVSEGTDGNGASSPSMATEANLLVAFIGDQGINENAVAVLQLILDEGADMVLHQGDLGYGSENQPQQAIDWNNQINSVLGPDFPYFASIGNHDVGNWSVYQQLLEDRLNRIIAKEGEEIATCTGDLGVKSACHYKGLFFLLTGPGTLGSDYPAYIREQLAQDDSIWSVCSWHKNQKEMQVGGKSSSVGWGPYEECRAGGALIATSHEHSYERTKSLINTETQTVDQVWSDPDKLRVGNGPSFVFVSGLGGASIRNQDRCQPTTYPYGCNGEWAEIYTSDQDAQYGVLFIEFNVSAAEGEPSDTTRLARGYFKNINGEVVDEFRISAPAVIQTITGIVTDGSGGVQGVNVTTDNGQSDTTDVDGNYILHHVPAGDRMVSATATGYKNQHMITNLITSQTVDFELEFSAISSDGGFGTVKGRIKDASSGGNLAKVSVKIVGTGLSTATSNGGSYAFYSSVPAGENYAVSAAKAGYVTQTQFIDVTKGSTLKLNLALQPVSGGGGGGDYGTIQGTVTASNGRNLRGVLITTDNQSATTNGRGRYTIEDVLPGEILVTATKEGYSPDSQTVTVIANQATTADFVLEPAPG